MSSLTDKLSAPGLPRSELHGLFGQTLRHLRLRRSFEPYRTWLGLARKLAKVPRHRPGVVTIGGFSIRYCDAASFLAAYEEIFVSQIYDIPFLEKQNRKPFLVDVGSNIGIAALYWKLKYADFDYLGFEADEEVARVCIDNLNDWGVSPQVHVAAVTREEGQQKFTRDGADGGSLFRGDIASDGVLTRTIRLSPYLTRSIDLLKLDIEGSEADVLEEIRDQLHLVRNIFVEVHACRGSPQHASRVFSLLESAGFRCFTKPARARGRPFHDLGGDHPLFDDQFNLFGVRTF